MGIVRLYPLLGAVWVDVGNGTYSGYVHVCTEMCHILNLAEHHMNVVGHILHNGQE